MKVSVIIVGGGMGRRLGSRRPKALLTLGGRPLFLHSVEAFARVRSVVEIILVLPEGSIDGVARRYRRRLARGRVSRLIGGGATRHASMRRGLQMVDRDSDVVMIHDAARPFVSEALIRRVARAAARTGAALPALQPTETVKQLNGRTLRTLDRTAIYLAQTPQAFRSDNLRRALKRLGRKAERLTDDIQLFEQLGMRVALVPGDPANVKITTLQDLRKARRDGL